MAGELMWKLNEADGRAVDLFLETRSAKSNGGDGIADPDAAAVSPQRLARVEGLFSIVSRMDAEDPPPDLAQRTVRRARRRAAARLIAPGEEAWASVQ